MSDRARWAILTLILVALIGGAMYYEVVRDPAQCTVQCDENSP